MIFVYQIVKNLKVICFITYLDNWKSPEYSQTRSIDIDIFQSERRSHNLIHQTQPRVKRSKDSIIFWWKTIRYFFFDDLIK